MKQESIFSLYVMYARLLLGFGQQSRYGATLKLGGALLVTFIVANAALAAAAQDFCNHPIIAAHFERLVHGVIFTLAFALALLIGSGALSTLYAQSIFDRYAFHQKAFLCLALGGIAAGLACGVALAQAHFWGRTCGIVAPSLFDGLLSWISGVAVATLALAAPIAVRVIPIKDTKITNDYDVMFDLTLRSPSKSAGWRSQRVLRPAIPVARRFPVLIALKHMSVAQFRIGASSVPRLLFFALFALMGGVIATAMRLRGDDVGVAMALAMLAILFAEVFSAPELFYEPRIAYSGRPFSRTFSLLLAPYARVVVVLAFLSSLFLLEHALGVIWVWIGAVAVIAARFLMRVAWQGSSLAAMRDGAVVGGGFLVGFQLLGPIAFIGGFAVPAYFYMAAKRRVERRG